MTIHPFPSPDLSPDAAADLFERIGRAWVRTMQEMLAAEGLEMVIRRKEMGLYRSSSDLGHG